MGPTAAPTRLRAAAPDMGDALGRAEIAVARLAAERLTDQRLEAQRARSVALLRDVLVAMRETHAAARAGQARRAAQAAQGLSRAVAALRQAEP